VSLSVEVLAWDGFRALSCNQVSARRAAVGLAVDSMMQRLIARSLLVLTLVGIFAPATLAFSLTPAHTCCTRKPLHNHTSHEAQFQAVNCCQRNCSRPLAVSRWAQPRHCVVTSLIDETVALVSPLNPLHGQTHLVASRSVRGPPSC
jgi:hypothetical protein